MAAILLFSSIIIQIIVFSMILYTFRAISEEKRPDMGMLVRYYIVRSRYERLRMSLLFVAALVLVQFIGLLLFLLFPGGPVTLAQLLISDFVLVALILFLSRIYRSRKEFDFSLDDLRATTKMREQHEQSRRRKKHVKKR